MSEFARGVIGVLAVGMVVGVGALMLIPQSSPSAMRFAEPPAKPCGAEVWPANDRVCEKWTAPRTHKADGSAAAAPMPARADAPSVAQSEPAAAREPARATTSRSAQNARVAQRRKAEGLREMRRLGDNLSDVGASAYAPNGTRRTTVRPASGARGPGAGVAQGNGVFPLFR
jgi:hypothetical protein